jgi:hypothetical protein
MKDMNRGTVTYMASVLSGGTVSHKGSFATEEEAMRESWQWADELNGSAAPIEEIWL